MKISKSYIKKGMLAELAYCIKMVESGHKSSHWAIRIEDINKQLTKGKANVKTKVRLRKTIRGSKE